ncbi:Homeobox protein CDX-2 [Camelus dromedarius]|uniref:Homeobox protein CDX-2 n=1 Tax=Camelus dromedarius TaxID=9838 RepID=A0A5N4D8S8_CAMDR|nr:Homeobox protein CDX-2 [Camelus dromedarius]
MYVSYLLDKDVSMYPSSVRHSGGLNLAPQNFVIPGAVLAAAYGAPLREDWNGYAPGARPAAANAVAHGLNGGSPAAAMGYSSPADYHPHHHPHHPAAAPSCASGLLQTLNPGPPGPAATAAAEQLSPGGQRRNLCEWMRKPAQPSLGSQVKTRTKDKYRVVYTDHQRLELEKEFHYSRYITIRRKAELAATLGLSERQVRPLQGLWTARDRLCEGLGLLRSEGTSFAGEGGTGARAEHSPFFLDTFFTISFFPLPFHVQVKIWFQNRRAKERKINKKKLQQQQPQPPPAPQPPQPQPGPLRSVPEPLSPVSSLQGSVPGSVAGVLGPTGGVLNPTVTQ